MDWLANEGGMGLGGVRTLDITFEYRLDMTCKFFTG